MKRLKYIGIATATLFALAATSTSALADDDKDKQQTHKQSKNQEVTIFFQAGTFDVAPENQEAMEAIAQWLAQDPGRSVVITRRDTADTNIQLGERRANALQVYLIDRKIKPEQIKVVKHGDAAPAMDPADTNTLIVLYATDDAGAAMGDQPVDEPMDDTEMGDEPMDRPEGEADYDEPTTVEPQPRADQPAQEGGYGVQPQPQPARADEDEYMPPTRYGVNISVGGGVTGFTDSDMRDFTSVGGAWEARAVFGTRQMLAVEGAYVGTAQEVDALGLDNNAILVSNGVEGNLRLNLLTMRLQPYVFAGVGWSRYDITNADENTSSLEDTEHVLFVPVGAGVGFRYRGLVIDLRGTFRPAFNDDIIRGTQTELEDEPNVAMDAWNASAKVGWEF